MDGNGRWAALNNNKRIFGHKKGVETVKKITEYCVKIKIKFLTLYTFSNENWKRPRSEIVSLMNLLVKSLDDQLELLMSNNIKLNVIGDIEKLDFITRKKLNSVVNKTEKHTGLNLNLAISYGSRQEIVNAINILLQQDKIKKINENDFSSYLYTSNIPDPDLLIRTGKEWRISNFLLWQIAYSEIYFSDMYWPDFDEEELKRAISDFKKRERRYGEIN
jgi:undecaprenyl diphosphate synthase